MRILPARRSLLIMAAICMHAAQSDHSLPYCTKLVTHVSCVPDATARIGQESGARDSSCMLGDPLIVAPILPLQAPAMAADAVSRLSARAAYDMARAEASAAAEAAPAPPAEPPGGDGEEQQQHASTHEPDAPRHEEQATSRHQHSAPQASSSGGGEGQELQVSRLVLQAGAPLVAGLALLLWLWRRLRRRGQQEQLQAEAPVEEEPPPTLAVWASDFRREATPAGPRGPGLLQGLRCAVAENIPVVGAVMGCGVPALWEHMPQAEQSAGVVERLCTLGAEVVGQASCQPFNSPDSLGDNIRNPNGRFRCAGGGCSGGTAAVAAGAADVALASEYGGSAWVPAASMGLFCLATTPGVLGDCLPGVWCLQCGRVPCGATGMWKCGAWGWGCLSTRMVGLLVLALACVLMAPAHRPGR